MSAIEKSKEAVEINSTNVKTILIDSKNLTDFNSQGNPKPHFELGKNYKFVKVVGLPLTGQKNSDGSQKLYPAFEVNSGNSFAGYLSLTSAQAREFEDIRMSKANKPYAKFNVKNTFGAPDGVVYGIESLVKLAGKTVKCTGFNLEHRQPKFGVDLTVGDTAETSDYFEVNALTFLEIVK